MPSRYKTPPGTIGTLSGTGQNDRLCPTHTKLLFSNDRVKKIRSKNRRFAMKKGKTRKAARSAITGKFVRLSYASKHPKTTVVQRIKK